MLQNTVMRASDLVDSLGSAPAKGNLHFSTHESREFVDSGQTIILSAGTKVTLWERPRGKRIVARATFYPYGSNVQITIMSDGSVKTKDLQKIISRFSGGRPISRSASD